MALTYTTHQALINRKLEAGIKNNIFWDKTCNYWFNVLWQRRKSRIERVVDFGLQYGKQGTLAFLAKNETKAIERSEIVTGTDWYPKLAVIDAMVNMEDFAENNSPSAREQAKIVSTILNNLRRNVPEQLATHFWKRTTQATKEFNTFENLFSATATIGGIAVADAPWWKTPILSGDPAGGDFNSDARVAANLEDPNADCYLPKILDRMYAKVHKWGKPTCYVMPLYLWHMLGRIKESSKRSGTLTELTAKFGFRTLGYLDIPIVYDDFMVAAQTGDTDGRIYLFNEDYVGLFTQPEYDMTMTPFREVEQAVDDKYAFCTIRGNAYITNRQAHCLVTNVASPKAYVS